MMTTIFRDKTKLFERRLYSCQDCPNLATPKKNMNYCMATEKRVDKIYIEDTRFPEWCPLDDER